MRAVVTRVKQARVEIDGSVVGSIGQGFLVLLGVAPSDTEAQAVRLADKVCGLRVFEDEQGKMNLNLAAVGGSLLVVSQFPCTPTARAAAPGLPARPGRRWRRPCMRNSWPNAGTGASPWSTARSAQICRCFHRTTGR